MKLAHTCVLVAALICISCTHGALRMSKSTSFLANRNFDEESAALLDQDVDSKGKSVDILAAAVSASPSFYGSDEFKGILCVLGGAMMHITLGSLYCWGNFLSYAPSQLRFFDGVDRAGIPDASLIMPATLVAQCLSMPFGPILVNKYGSKVAMMIGALVVGSGIFLSSYATTLASFMSLYAVVFGAGIGLAYTAPMIAGWKWLPTKKGLVSGAILTGFGAGGFFFNLIGTSLVNPDGENPGPDGKFPQSVYDNFPHMLRVLGGMYAIGGLAGSLLVTEPSAVDSSKKGGKAAPVATGVSITEALKTPQFWLIWSMIICSASAGLNVASIYKQFAATSSALVGDSFQAQVGGLGALFNGIGRLFWGSISDSLGFKKSFIILTVIQSLLHAYYPFTASSKLGFATSTCLCFFFLAGNFALVPPTIQKLFGPKNGALIYGLVYSAFGIASLGGSVLCKSLKELYGFEGVFRIMSILSIVGALLTTRLQPLKSLSTSTV